MSSHCYSDLPPELHELTLVLCSDECLDVHEQKCEPIPVVSLIDISTEIKAIPQDWCNEKHHLDKPLVIN